jgi:elongation factor Ts
MVREIARLARKASGSIDELKKMQFPGSERDVAAYVSEMVATIGENMNVRRAAALSIATGAVASYVHNQDAPGLGKIGVLVGLESTAGENGLLPLGRLLAMHIAAANPVAINLDGVSPESLNREKAILAEKNAGKPPHVMEKIIQSGLKSFAKEACLLDQVYVHDTTKTVAQALKEAESQLGAPIKIAKFVRYQLGEGIDKQAGDFASEVAKAAGAG